MNKWILLIAFCSLFNPAIAQQFSAKVCEQLELEQKQLTALLNTHISEKQQQRLTQRKKTLFANITHNCDLAAQPRSYKIANSSRLDKKSLADMSAYFRPYSNNHKQAAWVDYYELPQRCRSLAMSDTEFVWCSENRVKQRSEFESYFQQQPQTEIKPDDEVHEIILPKKSFSSATTPINVIPKQSSSFVNIAILGLLGFLLLLLAYSLLLKSKT